MLVNESLKISKINTANKSVESWGAQQKEEDYMGGCASKGANEMNN